ncbi:MAG: esterase-like activity of phytase family protein [Chitinophagaceae bacterium]|nr:esterase-like activity of phytase family protein [Chitinophagaceae bacterium]
MKRAGFVCLIFLVIGCVSQRKVANRHQAISISGLRLINQFSLPSAMMFKETVVGGLSGIDYDAKRDLYYMICDDPSTKGPARFYTARIPISDTGIDSVQIVDMTALLNPQARPYTDITKDRIHSADVEAMRYDSKRDELIWSSEGQRYLRDGKQELQNPSVILMQRDGRYLDSFQLPPILHIQLEEKGPRHNSVFEAIGIDETASHVYIGIEEPLYEDGPRAAGGDSSGWVRIVKFNRALKQSVAQFAYRIDPVPHPSNPPSAFKINGVSDILCLGNDQFLIIERAWSTGRLPSDVRLYLADAKGAQDVTSLSLKTQPPKKPITKKLLLDLNSLGLFIDNMEGVTFGPTLPNGNRTLLLVADDNFAKGQRSQFLLFEVVP